jgi:hypothetical protein
LPLPYVLVHVGLMAAELLRSLQHRIYMLECMYLPSTTHGVEFIMNSSVKRTHHYCSGSGSLSFLLGRTLLPSPALSNVRTSCLFTYRVELQSSKILLDPSERRSSWNRGLKEGRQPRAVHICRLKQLLQYKGHVRRCVTKDNPTGFFYIVGNKVVQRRAII